MNYLSGVRHAEHEFAWATGVGSITKTAPGAMTAAIAQLAPTNLTGSAGRSSDLRPATSTTTPQ